MTRRRRLAFAAVIVIQVLIVAGMAVGREIALTAGHRTTLQVVPVDPRDLFRGDYVVVNYEISRMSFDEVGATDGWWAFTAGDTVWVALREDDSGVARPVRITADRPLDADLAIRGTIEQFSDLYPMWMTVTYGIEQYFVPAGRGGEIQFASDVKAVVSIDGGSAQIDHLLVDGAVWAP